jgi:hypothetical protein
MYDGSLGSLDSHQRRIDLLCGMLLLCLHSPDSPCHPCHLGSLCYCWHAGLRALLVIGVPWGQGLDCARQ